jgi:membrane protein YdbS with pleckstrin-like domain
MPDIFINQDEKPEQTPKPKTEKLQIPKSRVKRERLEGHTHNPMASFVLFPERVGFETKEREEKVVLLLRKHPATNIRWLLTAFLMVIAPALLAFFPILDFLPASYQTIVVLGWYLIVSAYVLENFLSWFFNVYIVTDERIVDIDFYNLIYKEVSDANINRIQDVTYKMGGVVRTVFNYGDVVIQTASEVPNFDFLAVPKPDRVVKILQELRIEEEKEALEGRVR